MQALDAIIEMRINHFRSMPSISRSEDLSVSQFFTRVPGRGSSFVSRPRVTTRSTLRASSEPADVGYSLVTSTLTSSRAWANRSLTAAPAEHVHGVAGEFGGLIRPGVSGEFFCWEGWARGNEVIEAVSRRAEGASGADGGRSA
ncbi:hypothetical protein, partial [Mycolicibacterium sp.]|uniref:hypothetical protein n=1 Tax=Mycolicibacterium sp. TaxID=2320850 RepID=UPI003D0E5708